MFNLIESIRRWQRRSATTIQLSQLDDRLLDEVARRLR